MMFRDRQHSSFSLQISMMSNIIYSGCVRDQNRTIFVLRRYAIGYLGLVDDAFLVSVMTSATANYSGVLLLVNPVTRATRHAELSSLTIWEWANTSCPGLYYVRTITWMIGVKPAGQANNRA